jgi:hypothetical protein
LAPEIKSRRPASTRAGLFAALISIEKRTAKPRFLGLRSHFHPLVRTTETEKGASAAILVDTLPRWRRSADEALARTTMWLTSLCRCS